MLSFMNSKLTKMTGKYKQNNIFEKSKSYEISSTVIYIGEGHKFINHVFNWCIPLDHEICTECKNTHLTRLIKGISSHKICSGIKSQQVKKTICHSSPKTLDFSQNYSVTFHGVTFDHSISCKLLIDKPNESYVPIPQTSSEGLKLIIQTYQMTNKELKMKFGQLQEKISKASLPVSADLCNNFKSIILETEQRKMYTS